MPDTNRSVITNEVDVFYSKDLLVRVQPLLIHTKWAQIRDIPQNSGTKTIRFRRYGNLAAAMTPLQDGITPVGNVLAKTDLEATIAYYGDWIQLTDQVIFETMDPILSETNSILADQAADTIDQLCRDVMNAGTGVTYTGGGHTQTSDITASDKLTEANIDATVLLFKNNKCRKVTSMVDANTGFNTTPLNAAYIGIIHPNSSATLKGFTNFVPVEKYPSGTNRMEGEIGQYGEVRWIETSNAKIFVGAGAAGIDVYSTLIFGMNAYGTTRLGGKALETISKGLGSAGASDPLNQRQTLAWKGTFVAKILNDDFIYRIEHAKA